MKNFEIYTDHQDAADPGPQRTLRDAYTDLVPLLRDGQAPLSDDVGIEGERAEAQLTEGDALEIRVDSADGRQRAYLIGAGGQSLNVKDGEVWQAVDLETVEAARFLYDITRIGLELGQQPNAQ